MLHQVVGLTKRTIYLYQKAEAGFETHDLSMVLVDSG